MGLRLRQTLAPPIACAALVATLTHAQQQSKAPASLAPAAAATGPSGNATIETEMLSYEAMNKIAAEIARRVAAVSPAECNQTVLAQDESSIAQLTAFAAFDTTSKRLLSSYQAAGQGFVAGGAAFTTLSEVTGQLAAIRSTAVYTNQTFQPPAASMSNLLTTQLGTLKPSFKFYSAGAPGDLLAAAASVSKRLSDINEAQSKIDPAKRKDLDATYTALKTQLAASSADGSMLATVIRGSALTTGLGSGYCTISYSIDGAGGDTRVAHPFFWEAFVPTPHPSYSGGAVISYVYSTKAGNFLSGASLRYMYDFSKWHGCKLKNASNFDPSSDNCAGK